MTLTKDRIKEINNEYSKPNHSKSFSVKDCEIAAMAEMAMTLPDELEASEKRTITVKLPADYRNADGSLNADMMNTCAVVGAFREALAAAGITVKGE